MIPGSSRHGYPVTVTGDGPPERIPVTLELHLTLDEIEALGLMADTGRHPDLESLTLSALYWFGGTQGFHFPIDWFTRKP